jgi:hypothetical protein
MHRERDRAAVLLHVSPEALGVRGLSPVTAAHDHDATGPEQPERLRVTQQPVDPMQGVEGHERIECALWLPALEGRVSTSAPGKPARRRRATAASSEPSSTAVTAIPRSARGTVARPVPQPISATRSPGASAVRLTRSSKSWAGHTGLVRSYASAVASNEARRSRRSRSSDTSAILARRGTFDERAGGRDGSRGPDRDNVSGGR